MSAVRVAGIFITVSLMLSGCSGGGDSGTAQPSRQTEHGVLTGYRLLATPSGTRGTGRPVRAQLTTVEASRLAQLVESLPTGTGPSCHEPPITAYQIDFDQNRSRFLVTGDECAAAVSIKSAGNTLAWRTDSSCSLFKEIRRIAPSAAVGTRRAAIGCR